MSDLIAQLVARTLTSAPAIRPRLDPLFSTAPAIEEQVAEIIARPSSPSAPANDEIETETTFAQPPPRIEPVAEGSEIHTEHREVVSERINSAKPLSSPQPLERKSTPATTPVSQQPPAKEAVEATSVAALPQRAKTSRQVAPVIRPAAPRFEKEEAPSAAPIVRVTIGRIDVRAAPAPAVPARKTVPPPPPALTLDAYLNSRKGGAR